MGKTISATEAAGHFSDLLNKVAFRGERYTIARGGKAIAHLTPVTSPVTRRLGELPDLLKKLPSLGKDAVPFARIAARSPESPTLLPWLRRRKV